MNAAVAPGRSVVLRRQRQSRGYSLTIDQGWREVAETALAFTQGFVTR